MDNYFFDTHCHVMNLSHPGILSLVKRLKLGKYFFLNSLPLGGPIISAVAGSYMKKVVNLLSIMDRNAADFLLTMEEKDFLPVWGDSGFEIGGKLYNRIILTPLMMDFGSKEEGDYPGIWYNRIRHKSISEQVVDLFNGIAQYKKQSTRGFFEIFPFLGINTLNYDLQSTSGHTGLAELLDKYFSDYGSGNRSRYKKLSAAMGNFSGDIDDLKNYAFAGIKVYPPLGFDPWPAGNSVELEKVRYLYDYCQEKKIPLTTHCGGEGYRVITRSLARKLTSPDRWAPVLAAYPELKLNFAHFGGTLGRFMVDKRIKTIARFMKEYNGVYSDISCLCFDKKDYKNLERTIAKVNKSTGLDISSRILFGSDFMINLLWTESYMSYLKTFVDAGFLDETAGLRHRLCSENPAQFLFG